MVPLVAVTPIALADIAAILVVDIGESRCHHWQWTTLILLLDGVPSRTCEDESKGVLLYIDAMVFSLAYQMQEESALLEVIWSALYDQAYMS